MSFERGAPTVDDGYRAFALFDEGVGARCTLRFGEGSIDTRMIDENLFI